VDIRISEYQVAGHQGKRDFEDCPRTKFKNKIGAGSALILNLRNSGENPSLLRRSGYEGRKYKAIQREKNKKRLQALRSQPFK